MIQFCFLEEDKDLWELWDPSYDVLDEGDEARYTQEALLGVALRAVKRAHKIQLLDALQQRLELVLAERRQAERAGGRQAGLGRDLGEQRVEGGVILAAERRRVDALRAALGLNGVHGQHQYCGSVRGHRPRRPGQ